MSKEEMEVVQAPEEEVKEEVELTPEEIEAKQKKASLGAFILGILAFVIGSWFFGLLGIILGAIALGKAKKAKGVEVNPSKVFRLVGKILGIVGLIFGILDLLAWIAFICLAVTAGLGFAIYAIVIYAVMPAVEGTALALLAL